MLKIVYSLVRRKNQPGREGIGFSTDKVYFTATFVLSQLSLNVPLQHLEAFPSVQQLRAAYANVVKYAEDSFWLGDVPIQLSNGDKIFLRNCAHCGTRETPQWYMCGKCKERRFCGRACQKADWSTHKHMCMRD